MNAVLPGRVLPAARQRDCIRPMNEPRVVALGPVRHACHQCGTCCTGWRVQVHRDEHARVEAHAAALGVPEPIVEGTLRVVDGACVFLGSDRACAIHARFGEAEKPAVCRAFPRHLVHTEAGLRVGADPGCSSTWRTWVDGPEVALTTAAGASRVTLPPELAATEQGLIGLARVPGMTFQRLLGTIADDPRCDPKLPAGLLGRFLPATKRVGFFLEHRDAGPVLVPDLAKVAAFLRAVDAAHPPRWTLSRDQSGLALETLARTLFLRLVDPELPPMGALVLHVAGTIACAYAHRDLPSFGRALAAWSRLSRMTGFWRPLVPDDDAARYLLIGARA